MAIKIERPDGRVLVSSWAVPFGYRGDVDVDDLFSPYKSSVYSYEGESLTTWAHSGVIDDKYLFAQSWVANIRFTDEWKTRTIEQANEELAKYMGSVVEVCQMTSFDEKYLMRNYSGTCEGLTQRFEIVAAVIVMKDDVPQYEASVMTLNSFLAERYPESGFVQYRDLRGESWTISTCVGQFHDQKRPVGDDTKSYLFNRLIFGLRLIEEP